MHRSQGSIAALPEAINSLGLPDAQTVYRSVLTMTKSHPSEKAKELGHREGTNNNLAHSIIIKKWDWRGKKTYKTKNLDGD